MASCSRRTRKNSSSSLFKAERPHFFKIILPHSITQHNLGIPRKFVKSFGDSLSSPVILKVPSGEKWKVEIVRSEGEIWLQNGWREFAEYYSVVEGSFLVFEYVKKSNSQLNVIIFDKTATEIDYPFSSSNNGNTSERDNLDERFREPNVVVDEAEKDDVSVETLPSKANLDEHFQNLQKNLRNAEKGKAIERSISNFQSENPFFMILMQPSYVTGHPFTIPSSFARKYLNKKGDAILTVSDGSNWSIKYSCSICSGRPATRFNYSCWHKFVKHNHLQVGDVCIFELLEYVDKIIFKVAISKCGHGEQSKEKETCSKQPNLSFPTASEVLSRCLKRPRFARKCKISNARKKIKLQHSPKGSKKTENPGFQTVMQPSNFVFPNKYYLRVPRNFVKNMVQKSHKMKLQVENKVWSVKLNIYPQRYMGLFGDGWVEFARQNSLKAGDVCTFELIDTEILLVRVSISGD